MYSFYGEYTGRSIFAGHIIFGHWVKYHCQNRYLESPSWRPMVGETHGRGDYVKSIVYSLEKFRKIMVRTCIPLRTWYVLRSYVFNTILSACRQNLNRKNNRMKPLSSFHHVQMPNKLNSPSFIFLRQFRTSILSLICVQ